MNDPLIRSTDDVLCLLDRLLQDRAGGWWDGFFADRARPCPFFVDVPDENLAEAFDNGTLKAGRVLELGSGHGRNAVFMARRGCTVDAVDFSATALDWAREQATAAGVAVNFICRSIFELDIAPGTYDLVYDCGCFHHVPPHRRPDYLRLLKRALRPGGAFGLVCFRPEGGSGLSDLAVYEQRRMGGGQGYTEEQLRQIFSPDFDVAMLRPMRETAPAGRLFGKDFLWAAWMTRRIASDGAPGV